MVDFDRIFEPAYTASDLFTDRVAENQAFASALMGYAERLIEGHATLAKTARHNVLTFYGIGGVGKTELSRRLERWLVGDLSANDEWGLRPQFDQPIRTIRIDLHGTGVVDATNIVLCLRAAAAAGGGRFPAFDLAFAAWWGLARPGEPLPMVRGVDGFDLRTQISDSLNDVLSDAGASFGLGPFTVRTALRLVEAVRHGRLRSRALRDCAPLRAVVERIRFDPSPYAAATLAGLLSWDSEQAIRGEQVLLVAFVDAFEYVQGGERVQERLINRIVHLTPGVLWTVTSRRSLDWDSTGLQDLLPATGPHVWPGLRLAARAEPRQHLVGTLVDEDVDRYLSLASGAAGNPVLSADVRQRIRTGAHGLPLYLDLSLALARELTGPLDPAAFGSPLPHLVTRVLADLPPDERDIARTAGLLPRFEPSLVARATGEPVGAAQRFCTRPLVVADAHAYLPYRLHDGIRDAIANEDAAHDGAWTTEDRVRSSIGLLEAIQERHDQCIDDVDQRRDLLELAAGLCGRANLALPWLVQTFTDLPGMEHSAMRLPPPDDTWIGRLSAFFEGWRGGRGARERIPYLKALVESSLPVDIDRAARTFLAYAHRTLNQPDLALPILQQLLIEEPDSELLRYQIARTLHALGDYEALLRHLEHCPLREPTSELRIRSDLAYDQGRLSEAIDGPAFRAAYLESTGRHRIALENRTAQLWRRALAGIATIAECDAMISETDRHGSRLGLRAALAAKVIVLRGDHAAVRVIDAEVRAVLDGAAGRIGWREWSSRLIHGLCCGDRPAVDALHDGWLASKPVWTPSYQVVDRMFTVAGYAPIFRPRRVLPGDPTADDDARWRAVMRELVCDTPDGAGTRAGEVAGADAEDFNEAF